MTNKCPIPEGEKYHFVFNWKNYMEFSTNPKGTENAFLCARK